MPVTVAIITARWLSTRLPGKMLMDIRGKPMLQRVIDRCSMSNVDNVMVATTLSSQPIIDYCIDNGIRYCIGDEEDILSRLYTAALLADAPQVIRAWGDAPLTNPQTINQLLEKGAGVRGYAYAPLEPRGTSAALIHTKLLELDNGNLQGEDRHWYHKYCINRPYNKVILSNYDFSNIDLSVDSKESLELVRSILV